MVVCRVALLDGSTFEPKGIDKNSEGQSVYEKVVHHLDIIETDYFGLTFRDKTGKKFWLDHSKKISKQVKGGTWVFEFQVKFYPPDPMSLKEDITRYQLCLQVRVDIFNGRLPCSFATYALLGSYTVQAELGDWDPKEYGTGLGYLNDFDFAPTQNQELLEKIQELHQSHKGQTPEVAEAHFLENAKKLAMYGVDMHDVKDSDNKNLALGISANGILVYKDRLRINRFVWPKILKLSYKRNTFYVKIRPSEFEPHERTIGFLCDSHKLAKRLWKTCVEHHAFFRLKTADPPNADTLFPRFNTRFRYSGRTALQARKAAELAHREEPHIQRTAERRSIVEKKNKDGATMQRPPADESDRNDQRLGDDATLERDRNMAGLDQDGRYMTAPGAGDAPDHYGVRDAEEPGTEGPPGYAAAGVTLDDGGKKSKKEKEEEKKRKKEEERRRKEEEKERKRLEKERKKKGAQETNIDEMPADAAVVEQTEAEKKHHSGGFFAKLGRHSKKDKDDKGVNRPVHINVVEDPYVEQLRDDFRQLLRETPEVTSTSSLEDVRHLIDRDPRYVAVGSDERRQKWFQEYVDDLLKDDFRQLLRETPDVTSTSRLEDVKDKIDHDPRYVVVGSDDKRQKWFQEYVDDLLKADFMRLLRDTPTIHSQSTWPEARVEIDSDPRFVAVGDEGLREKWFDEYIQAMKKAKFMQLLDETPSITSYSRYGDVRSDIAQDPRFQNVDTEDQREAYFNEYVQDLLKEDFTQLLRETPDITSTSRLGDVKHKIERDPRYVAVDSDGLRKKWFQEYADDMLKADFMRLLRDTPTIHSQSTWREARVEIDNDPRFIAVASESLRRKWFNEYIQAMLKSEFTQMLQDTPSINSQTRWEDVSDYLRNDPRYQAVPSEAQRKAWFDDYIESLKKAEFMQLLEETPSITSYSHYGAVRSDIAQDPRFQNVNSEDQREAYFNEYVQNLKKSGFMQLLEDTPDISAYSEWRDAKPLIDTDPRYHAVNSDLLRSKWFNEYVNRMAGVGYSDSDLGYKSIDRRQEFLPLVEPTAVKKTDDPMPFFANARESEVYPIDRKKVPPPIAGKPKRGDELNNGVPYTVETESFKFSPDTNDVPRSTSNIPIVETKTHKVTYEKDGVPYETEESILISAHSVTTKSQTIDTTTYKTERDGVIETRVERKITVMTDEDDDIDHDALLRAAIEEVTNMNPDMSVEKIECMRQIEEMNER